MLDQETFKTVIENTPLFAIDLVVINSKQQILLGDSVKNRIPIINVLEYPVSLWVS